MEFYEQLFQALKTDNIKEFRNCMETTNCGPLRLGRFPVLSVMYLYKSRRLLRAYEKSFLKHNSWRDVGEPMELSAKFREVAGKCLRIYLNETVSPVEMLLLLDRDYKLKRVFSKAHVIPPVKQRLKDIYFVKWGLEANFERNQITLERRPLTRAEKLRWLMVSISLVLCVAIVVSTPFVVNVFSPFIPDGNGVINVSKWSQIRFRSNMTYALSEDITVPSDFYAKQMNCQIDGNGHKVTVEGNGLFGDVNGTLSNIVFETNGATIAEKVAERAVINRVTVNATLNKQVEEPCAFFVNDNYGVIRNVTLNASGKLTAVASHNDTEITEEDETPSFNCGGIVATNHNIAVGNNSYYAGILDCTANFDNFTLQGQLEANAAFGGIVGTNDGIVQSCISIGSMSADTFDVAGICAENNYGVVGCTNEASLAQTTSDGGWSPIVAGIVAINNNGVEGCTNNGAITGASTAVVADEDAMPSVYVGGIVGRAYGYVYHSVNTGKISSQSQAICAGGLVGASCAQILQCYSVGSIDAVGEFCYIGGVLGFSFGVESNHELYFGFVDSTVADCEIKVTKKVSKGSYAYVGGIVGFMQQGVISYASGDSYVAGKVVNSYFTGKLQANGGYVGAIVGVAGEAICLASESETKVEKKNFYSNVYVDSCGANKAFGAVFVDNDTFKAISDIGAKGATMAEIESDLIYQVIMRNFENTQD